MALYIPWLADAARLTGYPVVEIAGWRNTGHGGMRVAEGVGGHHTANPQLGDYPSLRIVRDGRADLLGPLSHLGLGRSGTTYVIAAGLCYHAGASSWAGLYDLNDEFIGIEAESVGTRDDWTAAQRDCYPRLVASLLYYMRRGAERFAGHKEICLPRGRKIDPAFFDLAAFRQRVAWLLQEPLERIPRYANPPTTPEDTVAYRLDPTSIPEGAHPDAQPDGSWWAVEDTITLPGPVGGWRGRTLAHVTFGYRGGFVQEAWSGPSGRHYVDRWNPEAKTGGRFVPAFVPQSWELPVGDRFLVVRYATPARGSVGIEPQH